MAQIMRRPFLVAGVRVAAGLVAFVPAARALAAAPTPVRGRREPRYVRGNVLKATAGQVQLLSPWGQVTLLLSPTSQIWKGAWDRAAPIAIADEIKAWGQPQADATFAVERMWVNIVNLIGPISGATPIAGGVRVQQQDRHTGLHTVTIDARTMVEQDGRDRAYSSEVVQLREGQRWQTIGLQVANGSVQATRLLPLV